MSELEILASRIQSTLWTIATVVLYATDYIIAGAVCMLFASFYHVYTVKK